MLLACQTIRENLHTCGLYKSGTLVYQAGTPTLSNGRIGVPWKPISQTSRYICQRIPFSLTSSLPFSPRSRSTNTARQWAPAFTLDAKKKKLLSMKFSFFFVAVGRKKYMSKSDFHTLRVGCQNLQECHHFVSHLPNGRNSNSGKISQVWI